MLPEHPYGVGETLVPIRFRFFYSTDWRYPTIDETLLGQYCTTESTRLHRKLAGVIFQPTVEQSAEKLLATGWLESPHYSNDIVFILASHQYCEVDTYLEVCAKWGPEIPTLLVSNRPPSKYNTLQSLYNAWSEKHVTNADLRNIVKNLQPPVLTDDRDVLGLRIKVASAFPSAKTDAFIEAHFPLFDGKEMGPLTSYFDEDRSFITQNTHALDIYEDVLTQIQRQFPNLSWTIEDVIAQKPQVNVDALWYCPLNISPEQRVSYQIYYACCYIVDNCYRLAQTCPQMCTQLYYYFACFVDLFYLGNITDEFLTRPMEGQTTLCPLEIYYPYPNRAFTAYDLPDIFNVIAQIPLGGTSREAPTLIGQLVQKCLPFASQRRKLTQEIHSLLGSDFAFFKVFSQLFWCLMGRFFPDNMGGKPEFNMAKLIQLRNICRTQDSLKEVFVLGKNCDRQCPVIIAAFRLWHILLVKRNHEYVEQASKCIDWNKYVSTTMSISKHATRGDWPRKSADLFKFMRDNPEKIKNVVYRYEKDRFSYDMLSLFSEVSIPAAIKSNILNFMIRVPKQDRYTDKVLCILMLPQFGGLSEKTIVVLKELLAAHLAAKPPKFIKKLRANIVDDIENGAIYWFFRCILSFERISLIPLQKSTIDQIDEAMMARRYILFPDQVLNPEVYSVYFTLCCEQVCTNVDKFTYGHNDIYLDVDTGQYCCAKVSKNANWIPCEHQPALKINLRGFMLVHRPKKGNPKKYMHCRQCGAFHIYNSSRNVCETCSLQSTNIVVCKCSMCGKTLKSREMSNTLLVSELYPMRKGDYLQNLYFCKLHYRYARRYSGNLTKKFVFKHTVDSVARENLEIARGKYL